LYQVAHGGMALALCSIKPDAAIKTSSPMCNYECHGMLF